MTPRQIKTKSRKRLRQPDPAEPKRAPARKRGFVWFIRESFGWGPGGYWHRDPAIHWYWIGIWACAALLYYAGALIYAFYDAWRNGKW